MSEGIIQPDGESVIFQQPNLEGIVCEVQHTIQTGKPFTTEPGLWGVGVVTLPTGQPRLVIQTKHADGASLSVTLKASEAQLAVECLVDAINEANRIAAAVAGTVRQ